MDEITIVQLTREIGLTGGSEAVAYELHRAWRAMGIAAYVITGHATEPDLHEGLIYSLPWLHRWGTRSYLRRLATLILVPVFTLHASWLVRRRFPQAIVVSHGDSLTGDVCVIHAVNRASLAEKLRSGEQAWRLNLIHWWVSWRDFWMLGGQRYRRLIAISQRVRQELRTYYHTPDEQIVPIPNGINLLRFKPDPDARQAIRQEFNLSDEEPVLLFVGNEFARKGLAFVIQALQQMQTKPTLLVVGADHPAPYQKLAQECGVADRLIFTGGRADVPRFYPAADVFVLPTMYETFSLVCIEAMAAGTPVVATSVGGIEDYLRHGENGLLINRDASDIAAQLDSLFQDEDLRARLRWGGLETAHRYEWGSVAGEYLKLFSQLRQETAASGKRNNSLSHPPQEISSFQLSTLGNETGKTGYKKLSSRDSYRL